jgi:hypothetical protein
LPAAHYRHDLAQAKGKFDCEHLIEHHRGSPKYTGLDFKAEQDVGEFSKL